MARKKQLSIFFWLITIFILVGVGFVVACNLWVVQSTKDRIFESVSEMGENGDSLPVGLVLGTSKKVAPHTPNQHFENRLKAAASLMKGGKVERLLVSGHRDSKYYDEPRDMIARLEELGIPKGKIIADNLGARTFESVFRAKSVYGIEKAVIVSDDFHVGRALFIADRVGLDAIALSSEPVDPVESRRVRIREYFARVRAVLDLYWLETGQRDSAAAVADLDE